MTPNDVTPGSSPAPTVPVEPVATPTVPVEPAPGSKTPSENLLAALQEEREAKKRLEEERDQALEAARLAEEALQAAKVPSNFSDEGYSDEAKDILENHVKPLAETVNRLTEDNALKDLIIRFPALKDKVGEFQEYRKGKPGVSLEDAAKIFLADNNLIAAQPRRKGLEEPRGGERTPTPTGMSASDIEHLRKTNYPEYHRLLMEGKLPLSGNA